MFPITTKNFSIIIIIIHSVKIIKTLFKKEGNIFSVVDILQQNDHFLTCKKQKTVSAR